MCTATATPASSGTKPTVLTTNPTIKLPSSVSPRRSRQPGPFTWVRAIHAGHFATWPGLTAELVHKHLPPSLATAKGHLDQQRQNIRSTQAPTNLPVPDTISSNNNMPAHTDDSARYKKTPKSGPIPSSPSAMISKARSPPISPAGFQPPQSTATNMC
jgi:hypothetical protein